MEPRGVREAGAAVAGKAAKASRMGRVRGEGGGVTGCRWQLARKGGCMDARGPRELNRIVSLVRGFSRVQGLFVSVGALETTGNPVVSAQL